MTTHETTRRPPAAMVRGHAAQAAPARRQCATGRATFRAAKNRSALTDPTPWLLHAWIFDGNDFRLCRLSSLRRRCSLQLQLQPGETLSSAQGAQLPHREAAARPLGCADLPRRRATLGQAKDVAGRCRGRPVNLSWSRCAPRMACGKQPQRCAGSRDANSPGQRARSAPPGGCGVRVRSG